MMETLSEKDQRIMRMRLRHRMAHVSVSLVVIFVAGLAAFGVHLTQPPMALTTALLLILLSMLEIFEALNLET